MEIIADPESMHRLVKQVMDSGRANSVEEATALFAGYRASVEIVDADDPLSQSALLTAVVLACRVFLGGVSVAGDLSAPLKSPLPFGPTLGDAVSALGGTAVPTLGDAPRISISRSPVARAQPFHVRTCFAGWRAGILPADAALAMDGSYVMPLAPMLAAALAVNDAYAFVSGSDASAGRRVVGLNMWDLDHLDWLDAENDGPMLAYLPSRLWLIGLGHLGQAYLWALGLLPFSDAGEVELVLQDMDRITASTPSTSILSKESMIGRHKTRAMAQWAEGRGFKTHIHERLFDGNYRRQSDEPTVALCGLDNVMGRQALDKAGFDLVIEAGLGRDHRNFQTMRLHTLPGKRTADEIWKEQTAQTGPETGAAYKALLKEGRLDQCGVTLLAGKAVGAPFVGSVAACLVVSEVLRMLHGGPLHELIDLDLRSMDQRTVVRQVRDFSAINPGYTPVR